MQSSAHPCGSMPFAGLTAAALLKNTLQHWFKKEEKVVLLTVKLFGTLPFGTVNLLFLFLVALRKSLEAVVFKVFRSRKKA